MDAKERIKRIKNIHQHCIICLSESGPCNFGVLLTELNRVTAERNELERRCEAAAKITTDPEVYALLNDAGHKTENNT